MNKCETCRANNICDHYSFGFETCGNYIPTNEWISVEDRLPEDDEKVLVCAYNSKLKFSTISIDKYSNRIKWGKFSVLYDAHLWSITHWMPLPEPPKGE